MNKPLIDQTKKLLDALPESKLKAVKILLELLYADQLSQKEWQSVYAGELDLKQYGGISWRKIAKTL